MIHQLPLPLTWPDQITFDNFYLSPSNTAIVDCLRQIAERKKSEKYICLYGAYGVGLSHLLYAACHSVQAAGGTALYLPLKKSLSPHMLEGSEHLSLICWDDMEAIAGSDEWEEALFHCYNRIQLTTTCLLAASHTPPAKIAWRLPDLRSRLTSGLVFAFQELSDQEKIAALQYRAKKRAFHLSQETAEYLLNHYPRDMHALFDALNKLDHYSLAEKRRLTIPFIKKILRM